MLPGFRFLFAAIVLSMSILVFGLGAAALLRAAHEEFAGKPTWHATPETTFAQQGEATRPVLALLRVDTPAPEQISDNGVAAAAPETSTAAKPDIPPALETARPEIPAAETSPPAEAALTPVTADIRIAAVVSSEPAAAEPAGSPGADLASTKIATLGGPAVTIEVPAASAEPDKSSARKHRQAQRAKARRRVAQRARLTAQAPQQPADGFAQPAAPVRSR